MTAEQLANIILNIPAHEPRALVVLREQREATGELFPVIEQRERAKIFYEMRDMREKSTKMIEALEKLKAIPVKAGHDALLGYAL